MCQKSGSWSDRLQVALVVLLLSLGCLVDIGTTHGQTMPLPKVGESTPNVNFTLTSLSDDLVERLTKRIEQLESLKAKSEALQAEVQRLSETSQALQTTLTVISLSRDDFKLKYENEKLAVENAKKIDSGELEKVRRERDSYLEAGMLVGMVGLPVGVFAGGVASGQSVSNASTISLGVAIVEAIGYGVWKFIEFRGKK